jgi:hypothetical protein
MRKLLPIIVIGIFIFSGLSAVAISNNVLETEQKSREEGEFTAEFGRRGSSEPLVYLDGNYKTRGRFKVIYGTATTDENRGRFRGIFMGNRFIVKVSTPRISISIYGRVTFDEQTFEGSWLLRSPRQIGGWIEGEFTPN